MVASFCWGMSFLIMTILLKRMTPLQILADRWLLAAVLFLALIGAGKVKINVRSRSFKFAVLAGILEPGCYSILEIYGLKFTSASVSSIFIATIPCMTLIIGGIFFHQKASRQALLSIALAFAGVVICVVFSPDFSMGGSGLGYLLMIGAVVLASFYSFSSARASEEIGPGGITAVMAIIGAVVFNAITFFQGEGLSTYRIPLSDSEVAVGIVLLGLFCSSLCYICFNKVLSMMDTAIANNLSGSMTTVVGVLAGIFLGGDSGGFYTAVGVAMTLTGVFLATKDA